jgi:hypothetical protein
MEKHVASDNRNRYLNRFYSSSDSLIGRVFSIRRRLNKVHKFPIMEFRTSLLSLKSRFYIGK